MVDSPNIHTLPSQQSQLDLLSESVKCIQHQTPLERKYILTADNAIEIFGPSSEVIFTASKVS